MPLSGGKSSTKRFGPQELNLDASDVGEARKFQLQELEELRYRAYESLKLYKERTKKAHDARLRTIKELKEGDQVLLYNSRLKFFPRKLVSRCFGPFTVTKILSFGAIEVKSATHPNPFVVNGHCLKHYWIGDTIGSIDEVVCEQRWCDAMISVA